jgi:bifunctional non-homologous end joining protein LigD
MNGADWSKRYPRIVEAAARIKVSAVMDAEVVCLDERGVPNFDTLHSRTADHLAVACAFDLLMVNGDDLRRQPLRERKLALGKLLLRSLDGIQYVEHAEGHGDRIFEAVCKLGLEGIVSKKLRAKRKGQAAQCETDLTLTTAYLGGTEGHAVLKITFAELLRSGSRNISSPCCGVYVTHAASL